MGDVALVVAAKLNEKEHSNSSTLAYITPIKINWYN